MSAFCSVLVMGLMPWDTTEQAEGAGTPPLPLFKRRPAPSDLPSPNTPSEKTARVRLKQTADEGARWRLHT